VSEGVIVRACDAFRGIGNARTLRSTVIRSDGERLQDQVRDRIRV
jgi:hypothetical protein